MTLPEKEEYSQPYRKVSWLSHTLSRRDFPAEVARRFQNRKAITRIDPEYYEEIFKRTYHAYVWGGVSKIDVFAPVYNSNDPTATQESSFLIKYAIAYYIAFERGEIEAFNDMDLEIAAATYFDPAYVIQVAQAFGSPGGYIARLIGAGAALAVGGILAMALSDESQPIRAVQSAVVDDVSGQASPLGLKQVDHLKELTNSVRAGNAEQLRQKYGRGAKAKLSLSLNGETSPAVSVKDRIRP